MKNLFRAGAIVVVCIVHEVITEQTLSNYYELDVKMLPIDDFSKF